MALKSCAECKATISTKLTACPSCGAPTKPRGASPLNGCLFMVCLFMGMAALGSVLPPSEHGSKSSLTPGTPRPAKPLLDTGPSNSLTPPAAAIEKPAVKQQHDKADPKGIEKPVEKGAKRTVTRDDYDKLKNGMSYNEAVEALGSEGRELPAAHTNGGAGAISSAKDDLYLWSNDDGSTVKLTFRDGNLIKKAQFKLH